jgi:hypothetical protein
MPPARFFRNDGDSDGVAADSSGVSFQPGQPPPASARPTTASLSPSPANHRRRHPYSAADATTAFTASTGAGAASVPSHSVAWFVLVFITVMKTLPEIA